MTSRTSEIRARWNGDHGIDEEAYQDLWWLLDKVAELEAKVEWCSGIMDFRASRLGEVTREKIPAKYPSALP